MWTFLCFTVLLFTASYAQPQQNRCSQAFGNGIQACFQNIAGVDQAVAYSILSSGSTGPLPQGANKDAITQNMCRNYQQLGQCLTQLKTSQDQTCQQNEVQQNVGTVNSLVGSMGTVCGVAAPASQCLQQFESSVDECVKQVQVTPEQFKAFLSDPNNLPQGFNAAQLQQRICSDASKQTLLSCAQNVRKNVQAQCQQTEITQVDGALQGVVTRYETVCTPCWNNFQQGMNACISRLFNLDRTSLAMVMNASQTLPNGMNRQQIKSQICAKGMGAALRDCGRDLVTNAKCPERLTALEFEFARLVMGHGQFCGDQSLPGLCLLNLQSKFGECYSKVGLDPKIYLGNDTQHQGALIGSTASETQLYCSKKDDLYTCMTEVMQSCPGAEQTLVMTGFDLHSMERAVGLLCHDVPDYLEGLKCFAEPTQAAIKCMNDMTTSLTEMSAKQLQQNLDMDMFLSNFCTARVAHVNCDARAWPSCNPKAVGLKNEFECQLIPSKCYNSHKDDIDNVCPNTNHVSPTDVETIFVDALPMCAQNIENTMTSCFQQHGLEADMFLVNITHDRRSFLGDERQARSLCNNRAAVFKCMRDALSACSEAEAVLAYWGHQQSALEAAVGVICKDLNLYTKGVPCFSNSNAMVQQCVSNTEGKMMQLAMKREQKKLSADMYFREFCSLRVEHLKCDLSGWQDTCSPDTMGLKTEFECTLLQENCRNLQVSSFKKICNPQTYQSAARTGSGGSDAGGANAVSSSGVAVLAGIAASFALLLL